MTIGDPNDQLALVAVRGLAAVRALAAVRGLAAVWGLATALGAVVSSRPVHTPTMAVAKSRFAWVDFATKSKYRLTAAFWSGSRSAKGTFTFGSFSTSDA